MQNSRMQAWLIAVLNNGSDSRVVIVECRVLGRPLEEVIASPHIGPRALLWGPTSYARKKWKRPVERIYAVSQKKHVTLFI